MQRTSSHSLCRNKFAVLGLVVYSEIECNTQHINVCVSSPARENATNMSTVVKQADVLRAHSGRRP